LRLPDKSNKKIAQQSNVCWLACVFVRVCVCVCVDMCLDVSAMQSEVAAVQ